MAALVCCGPVRTAPKGGLHSLLIVAPLPVSQCPTAFAKLQLDRKPWSALPFCWLPLNQCWRLVLSLQNFNILPISFFFFFVGSGTNEAAGLNLWICAKKSPFFHGYNLLPHFTFPFEPDSGVYASANVIIAVPVGKRGHTFGVCRVFLSAEDGFEFERTVCVLTCLCIKGLFFI